jgi:hypothetical protein
MPYLAQLVQLDFSRHQKLKFDIRTRQMFLQQEIHLFRGKKVCKTAGIWTLQQFQDLFLPTFARELKVLCEPRAGPVAQRVFQSNDSDAFGGYA